MKKRYIFISVGLIALISIISWGVIELQKVTITFNLSSDVKSVRISQDGREVGVVARKSSLRLAKGDYLLEPMGEKIDTTSFSEKFEKTREVVIDPDYSEGYLSQEYKNEATRIATVLDKKFPSQMKNFQLINAQLFKKGEWGGGVLVPNDFDAQNPVKVYRVVFSRINGGWDIVKKPQPVLTKFTFSNVPVDVLRNINQLSYSG